MAHAKRLFHSYNNEETHDTVSIILACTDCLCLGRGSDAVGIDVPSGRTDLRPALHSFLVSARNDATHTAVALKDPTVVNLGVLTPR